MRRILHVVRHPQINIDLKRLAGEDAMLEPSPAGARYRGCAIWSDFPRHKVFN